MLGCMASGVKFPAFIIWKGVRDGRIHQDCQQNVFPGDSIYTVQPSGWMDGEAFQEWVQRVIWPFAELHNNSLYLLLDQFSVHMQHNNTFALQQIGIEVDFIPVGYTPVLQVLDKRVHKPFKQYLREESIAFMVNNSEGTKPTRLDIAHWIRQSWDQVQHSTILNTWHSIGIHPFGGCTFMDSTVVAILRKLKLWLRRPYVLYTCALSGAPGFAGGPAAPAPGAVSALT
jgi:hypothetical protein